MSLRQIICLSSWYDDDEFQCREIKFQILSLIIIEIKCFVTKSIENSELHIVHSMDSIENRHEFNINE